MKIFSIMLLLITFHVSAKEENGVVVSILPDQLVLSNNCIAIADLKSKELSIIYACEDSLSQKYFFNFRLNNIDLVADFKRESTDVVVKESQFNSYTLYELTAKNSDNNTIKFVSYCTKELCLDLVSDNEFEKSIQDSITAQLGGK